MRKVQFFFLLVVSIFALISCNLSDFQLNKLATPTDFSPFIYRPVLTASYAVETYAVVKELGNTPFKEDSLIFSLLPSYPLDGMALNTAGNDSVTVIIKSINETPMKYRYRMSLSGTILDSGSKQKYLAAATVNTQGDVISNGRDSLEYHLSAKDVTNLGTAKQFDLAVTLYQPDIGPVVANVLKDSKLSFYIGVRVRVNLFKIK
jgi:hypothetical protein